MGVVDYLSREPTGEPGWNQCLMKSLWLPQLNVFIKQSTVYTVGSTIQIQIRSTGTKNF